MKRKILLFIFTLILVLTGITNIKAYDKYDGDYTIEYLLKNYNVVTLGTKERYDYTMMDNTEKTKGSVTNVFDIGGPVLIRGNYTGNASYDNEFAQKTNCIPSYVKGNLGNNINPGSVESAELSNIYVGSNNVTLQDDGTYKLKGSNNEFNYPIIKSDDYLDFDKLYAAIVNEQTNIDKGIELVLQTFGVPYCHFYKDCLNISLKAEINKPGFYTIAEDFDRVRLIVIDNYDPSETYVITNYSDEIYTMPLISVSSFSTSLDSVYCGRTNNDEICTGNIIWNFPNARYIHTGYSTIGHIVAPKADIELAESHYPGTIIANSITSENADHTAIQFYPYTLDKKISNESIKTIVDEKKELSNDLYAGDYSIDELLKNYSVVTLGQKQYGNTSKLSALTDEKGTASIFHMSGQILINGDLGVRNIIYSKQNFGDFDGIRLDFKSTDKTAASYIKGSLKSSAYDLSLRSESNTVFYHANDALTLYNPLYVGKTNEILNWTSSTTEWSNYASYNGFNYSDYLNYRARNVGPRVTNSYNYLETIHLTYNSDNYIDFKVLYDAIVEQQKAIESGQTLTKNTNNNVHVKIGENYTIENVSDIENIIFTNYADNKNKLTIVTIKDEGEIILPVVGYGQESSESPTKVYTNDWAGKSEKTYDTEHLYEENYYGNIVWNIPNATHIKLAEDSPFIGHIIAPNADVETDETHFAGAMICNSLYTEGHSEAHFYPLIVGSVGTGIELQTKTIGDDETEKITISGTKTWDDNDNQDGLRPDSVTINLLANGEKVDSLTITEDDNWKYIFNGIDRVDEKGVKINYTITENAIEHYATNIEPIVSDTCPEGCVGTITGYNITNSYTPKKTSLTVNKVWKDGNNADKLRPESVEVELYANGEKVDSATLNEKNNWTYIFNEIDMNENGKKIEYTVKETTKLKGYTTSISGDQETGYTITNTHIVKKENPTTGDNIKNFLTISVITSVLLVLCIILFARYRRKNA